MRPPRTATALAQLRTASTVYTAPFRKTRSAGGSAFLVETRSVAQAATSRSARESAPHDAACYHATP